MATTHLLLGSNLGDRKAYLDEAKNRISQSIGTIKQHSAIYKTEPWQTSDQDSFYNQAVEVHTALDPNRLLKAIHAIEQDLARVRNQRWGPRTIDIDIMTYDDRVLVMEGLCVPHRLMHKRRFALEPMVDICKDYEHPVMRKSLSLLLDQCADKHMVVAIDED